MSGDLKSILAVELKQLGDELSALTPAIIGGDEAAAEQALTLCERLGQAADMLQMPSLHDFAVFLMSNVAAMVGVGDSAKPVATACTWLEHCLNADASQSDWDALRAELCSSDWPSPLPDESASNLFDALRTLDSGETATKPETPTITADDLTLTPSDEASPETRRAYFAETPMLAAELSSLLANGNADSAGDAHRAAQRLVHTIKGSSSLLGLQAIAHLAHALEAALQRANASSGDGDAGLSDDGPSDDLLSHAADTIEALIEAAAEGGTVPSDLLPLIHELYGVQSDSDSASIDSSTYATAQDYADSHADTTVVPMDVARAAMVEGQAAANAFFDKISDPSVDPLGDLPIDSPIESPVESPVDSPSYSPSHSPTPNINDTLTDSQVLTALAASAKPAAPSKAAEPAASSPSLNVPVAIIDDNLRRTGELNTAIGQLIAHVGDTLRRADQLTQQLARVQGQVYELETLVDTRGVPAIQRQTPGSAIEGFDPLELDEYTALHSLSRAFAESTLDSRELSRELAEELLKLQNLLTQHARLGRELDDSVTGARLVPVATVAPRLERIVRQTARQASKQGQRDVELAIHGRELSIDTDILNGLVEPLMHALRNAVDHGIEDAEQRRKAGKPAAGHIRLDFKREGNRIEVRVQDDGRGLDFEAIARRAHERGLLSDGKPVNERELTQLIFTPGFSTRDAVTAVSGRGIGMDVVRASIERLKGTISFESKPGAGCTLLMRLPLSLTSQHTLFVGVADCVYGLPSTSVEQVLYSDAGRIIELGDRPGFEYGAQIYPLHSLGALLGHAESNLDDLQTTPRPLVLARVDSGATESVVALVVDRALDSRQIVVKGLSPMLPGMPGVAGAAVMPDGGIGVILEVRELLRTPEHQPVRLEVVPSHGQQPTKHTRRALVVDDSLSARRGLAQLLGDAGYDVITAIDGLDALSQIETAPPDLILVDMEMPRMNGLELTAHLRGHQTFNGVPIVMITSRATEKHRSQALRTGVNEYITKPYLEHDLIDRLFTLAPP